MSHKIHSIAVYCASSNRVRESYFDAAYKLGTAIGKAGIELIYGDGGIGLMGEIARGVLDNGGRAVGIIPQFMVDEGWNNPNSTETHIVETMHQRKAMIEQLADGMVALPGGIGTFEELLECLTWKQLGLHTKPIVILNKDGYFDPLLDCLDRMIEEHFMRDIHRNLYVVVNEPEEVLEALENAPEWSRATRRDAAL